METVAISELQDNLPAYVKRASAGERILVVDQNEVVAELTPPTTIPATRTDPAPDPLLTDLISRGLATPPRHAQVQLPKSRGKRKLADICEELTADRADR